MVNFMLCEFHFNGEKKGKERESPGLQSSCPAAKASPGLSALSFSAGHLSSSPFLPLPCTAHTATSVSPLHPDLSITRGLESIPSTGQDSSESRGRNLEGSLLGEQVGQTTFPKFLFIRSCLEPSSKFRAGQGAPRKP